MTDRAAQARGLRARVVLIAGRGAQADALARALGSLGARPVQANAPGGNRLGWRELGQGGLDQGGLDRGGLGEGARGQGWFGENVPEPGVLRPGVLRPGVLRPGVLRPGVLRPGAPAPGVALALVDACHPFDQDGPAHARAQAARAGVPLLVLRRPLWRPSVGDRWHRAQDAGHAARLLAPRWRRVFLAVGRDRIAPFAARPARRYFVRVLGPASGARRAERLLRDHRVLAAPGPFDRHGEARLFARLGIDALVARNAGGEGARPKLLAARALGLPVVLIEPPRAPRDSHASVGEIIAALAALAAVP
jgi:precorrin-6A/cobalt-precorrin-6A reductase